MRVCVCIFLPLFYISFRCFGFNASLVRKMTIFSFASNSVHLQPLVCSLKKQLQQSKEQRNKERNKSDGKVYKKEKTEIRE